MKISAKKLCIISLALLCLYFAACCSMCNAQERMYTVTEAELTQLESKLQRQDSLIVNSQQDLKTLREQLATSQKELTVARQQLAGLTAQLDELQKTSQKQSELIESANSSLQRYAKEVKAKERIIKRQRNIAYVLLGGVVIMALK